MSSTPLISICIPAYNRPDGLRKAIKSIISQEGFNEKDVEIMIIDDRSPTDLTETAKPFSKKFNNIHFFRNKKNLGFEKNILKLLRQFRGEYFFFLTDDDFTLPGAIKKIKHLIKEYPDCPIFSSSYRLILEKQKKEKIHRIFHESKEIGKNDINAIAKLYKDTHAFSRICLKRDSIDIAGFKRHIGSMYPHMYLVGQAALRGGAYYSVEPLVGHLAENVVFWQYTSDYMVRGQIQIIEDLAKINPKFYQTAMEELIKSIPGIMYQSLRRSPTSFVRFVFELLRIPEIDSQPVVWLKIFREAGVLAAKKIYEK